MSDEKKPSRTYSIRIPGVLAVVWAAGIVLAKGFWSTLAAVLVPPWGWYLCAEYVLHRLGGV